MAAPLLDKDVAVGLVGYSLLAILGELLMVEEGQGAVESDPPAAGRARLFGSSATRLSALKITATEGGPPAGFGARL